MTPIYNEPPQHGGFTPGNDGGDMDTIMPMPRGPVMGIGGGMEGLPFQRGPVMGIPQRPPGMGFGGGLLGGFPGFGGGSFGGGMPWMQNRFGGIPGFGGGGGFPGFGGGFGGGGGFYGGSFMPNPWQQNMYFPGIMPPWMGMGMNTNFSPSANMFQNQMMRSQQQYPGGFFGFQPPQLPQLPMNFWGAPTTSAPGMVGGGGGGSGSSGGSADEGYRPSDS